jgi:hypothetical protein
VSATARTNRSRRRPVFSSRRLLAGGLVVSAAFALSGCGQAGVAAQVNDRTITVDHLQSAVASLRAADKQAFGKVTNTAVLSVLLYGPYAEQAASAAGKGVSDDAVKQAVLSAAQQNNDKTADVDRLNAAAIEALRGNIAFSQLDDPARQAILDQLKKDKIKISPRYGTFDPANGSIIAPSPNWLPKPAATPSPSATG